ncbi:TetR/AcrR family transcriptional regulator [Hymenobacter sp. GOD-10R]|uniref:TetR/AcrR family transcriptional regulator n=1 Tax=Hymenobacter sp. GOD-10R TaxID=3093922 RepID=UPI002D779B50|nr:TetR/AcrR family transcriptional regulator [Hymenobacter sp. GOD-10R]WRQ27898.1 TetR/AcrR family transcriptional regulator [Hymenobacter sp. GOD-10R]
MEIKDRILQSAGALFSQRGLKSVSMDDIATHLAVSKKTLYKWFENKDQIVQATLEQYLSNNQCEGQQLLNGAANAIDEFFLMLEWIRNHFADIVPGIFYDMQKYYPGAWQLWLEHKNTFILAQIKANLQRGITEGLYRPELDVEVIARMRLALIELLLNAEVYPPRQFSQQRVQTCILEHFMLGIASLKGYKLINQYRHVTEEE